MPQLVSDVRWIYSLQPDNQLAHAVSICKLIYWHLVKKKLSRYAIGTYLGNYFLYDHQSDGCATAYITPNYDYSIQTFITSVLKPKNIFIDIGANVGTETLLAINKGAFVHSFEPTSDIFSQLQINISLNGYSSFCKLQKKAVADKDGLLRFYVFDSGHQLLNSLVKSGSHVQKRVEVPAISLDTYFHQQKIDSVALLKIDVEGAEHAVILGAKKILKQGKVPAIIWESNLQASSDNRAKTSSLLDSYGYVHFWWNADLRRLEKWSNQENCFSILKQKLPYYKKLLETG